MAEAKHDIQVFAAHGDQGAPSAEGAWATLVMLGDQYVPGALVLAQSLQMVGTRFDRICMITEDVSESAAVALRRVFDGVVTVPFIKKTVRPLPGAKQSTLYPIEVLSASFTKWNCLALPYERVCFVDADIAFRLNPDAVFDLHAPAASFVDPWQTRDLIYGYPAHGDTVPHGKICRALETRNGFAAFGSLVLLQTSLDDLRALHARLDSVQRYGDDLRTHSGPDELSITELYARRGVDWTQIGPHFHAMAWKQYGPRARAIAPGKVIGYHYFGAQKPWAMPPTEWPDLKTWWDAARALARAAQANGWWGDVKAFVPVE